MNGTVERGQSAWEAFMHGACLVLLDGLAGGKLATGNLLQRSREMLLSLLPEDGREQVDWQLFLRRGLISTTPYRDDIGTPAQGETFTLSKCPFSIAFGSSPIQPTGFALQVRMSESTSAGSLIPSSQAPTTSKNVMRMLRGMQLAKPILLEGSPGVGKVSFCCSNLRIPGGVSYRSIRLPCVWRWVKRRGIE